MKILGEPKTIGELKKLLEKYPDEIPFGFRGQPIQELIEIRYGEDVYICFQETDNNITIEPLSSTL